MRAPLEIKNHDDAETLRHEIRHAKDGKYQLRLRAILMCKEGAKSIQIQRELKIGPHTYARWVKKYNEGGKEALARMKQGNKKGRVIWEPKIFDELVEEIRQSQEYWTLKRMQSWIEKRYGKTIHLETIRYNVRKRGLSHKSARPSPYLGDKGAQEDFKKKD